MGQAWMVLIVGSALLAMGFRTMNGRQAGAYRRPRVAAWSGVTGGAGLAGSALFRCSGPSRTPRGPR
ncbi:hypothetical protein [Streptacidiphilus sp. P02-A3a]|uniref:hypothetical protein n=1 Tax=Streptacidiphilus sp. P02-A3a TaxID=2704468 RepID=UPI0015FA622E|nr:hypothetical protein [Streptacidiphilus sp. P02-A3a]QMU73414.1 hypothetical protein GXP74_39525 [Streptacidiphilus sp. P02-A3a]